MSVSPRASKEEFMAALGLSTHDPQHEQYYRAMRVYPPYLSPYLPQPLLYLTPHTNQNGKYVQDEAISTYNHLNESPSNLLENYKALKPPYFWHHIRPERQRWGINEIARNASPLTRPLFARGMTTGEYGPNWVAGWLLYSVFRSRDVRNNRNRRRGVVGVHQGGEDGMCIFLFFLLSILLRVGRWGKGCIWFDGMYVHWLTMLYVCIGRASSPQMGVRHDGAGSAGTAGDGGSGSGSGSGASSGKKEYYDPVRNG